MADMNDKVIIVGIKCTKLKRAPDVEQLPPGTDEYLCSWNDRFAVSHALLGDYADVDISPYGLMRQFGELKTWDHVIIRATRSTTWRDGEPLI